ncbi:MAG TPA: PhnA domain-containing protein, partial [Flavobacterium sp.]|nr:PhnA domain-containing protein [Flavobacterium sp.]
MSVVTEKRLKDRSGSKCEISGSDENLVVYLVEPKTEATPENCILITKKLKDQIENPKTTNANDWRGLSDSMWNENLPVQIVSWRMLARLKNIDMLEMMYLDEDALEWAKATGEADDDEGKIVHKDSNGNVLLDGDSVVLIKD